MPKLSTYILLSFFLLASCGEEANDTQRPNILLINIDDMGYKDVGFMGSDYYETPNIDALAGQGMVFTNGYAAAANCAPSRACLMTGKWTPRHGIYTVGNSDRGESKDRKLVPVKNTKVLRDSFISLPSALQQHGYTTCHAGKWHLSKDPLEYGFDKNIGGGFNGMPLSYYPPYRNVNIEAGQSSHLTDLVMEKAIEHIENIPEPFFLYYSPYAVHTPIQPIDSLLPKYRDKAGSNGQQNAEYATMIENMDRNIGLLVAQLRANNQFDNTLIVFTSDNGGLYGITQQKPLRAGKGSYYEGGIREPFFFVWKNNIAPATSSDTPITNLDIFPTIAKAARIDLPDRTFDGVNLLPLLQGKVGNIYRSLFWHFPIYLQAYDERNNENRDSLFRTRPGSVIRQGEWKLHYYFEDEGVELYNLIKDPGEKNNVAATQPKMTDKMLLALKNWWQATDAPIPTTLNPEYEEAR